MILIENLNVKLGDFTLKDINLNIRKGEFFAILGPTGTGKSVLLEAIAGVKPVKSGEIIIDGKNITKLKPEKRAISICYQDYCIFPHMTVRENINYGLRFRKDKENPKYKKNFDMLIRLLKIDHLLERYPQNLSGGEKQRISLARGLIVEPEVLLLDEPLSALDPNIKERIQHELKKIHDELKITTIMVTHDFQEAHFLADSVGIMDRGQIIQQGTLEDIFQNPKSKVVADFVGMKTIFKIEEKDLKTFNVDEPCYIGIRPERIKLSTKNMNSDYSLKGKIISMIDTGIYVEIRIKCDDKVYIVYVTMNYINDLNIRIGEEIFFGFNKNDVKKIIK